MRRTTLVVVVALLLAAELGTRAIATRLPDPLFWNDEETQNKAARMQRREGTGAAIAFAGSSSMNAAADARVIARSLDAPTFNASLNGADMRSVEFWIRNVVLPRLHPRVVVVGTTSLELNDRGITQREFYDKLTGSQAARRLTGRESTLDALDAWLADRSYLVRYRTELRRPASAFGSRNDDARVDRWGTLRAISEFHRRPYGLSDEFRRRTSEESFRDHSVGGPQLDALRSLAAMLERQGVKLVLVKMPVTDDVWGLHPHGRSDYERYERALGRFAASSGVVVVDAASTIRERRSFVDPIHLNAEGMRRFTELLAHELRRLLLHA